MLNIKYNTKKNLITVFLFQKIFSGVLFMKYNTLKEFWPYYLSEHSKASNRTLHFIGSSLGLICFSLAIYTQNLYYLLGGFLSGYAFAWIGHFFIEKNRPATFQYPLKSFISDWIMFYYILTGQIKKEIDKISVKG
jgi:hypothetical protein